MSVLFLPTLVLLDLCVSTGAAIRTWDGGGSELRWTVGANWMGDVAPTGGVDGLVFAGTTGLTTTNDFPAGTVFNGLSFSADAGPFVLNGNSLALGGSVADSAGALQTINLGLGLGGETRRFTVENGGQLEISQGISGEAGVIKDGAGVLMLSARSSYAGGTVISNGVVRLVPALAPVPGMIYWLDAGDLGSLSRGVDNKVSQWNDRSGNGRHFAQTDAARQPLYVADALSGKPAVRFDGSDDRLVLPGSTSPQTVFIVNRVVTGGGLRGLWGLNQADKGIRMSSATTWQHPGNGDDFSNPAGSVIYVNGVATNVLTAGAAHLLTVARSVSTTFSATGLGDYFYVSGVAPRPWGGDIAEVLVYGRALMPDEQQQVEAYLTQKWFGAGATGLAGSPPVSGSVLWLDAANTGAMVRDANNRISRWNDAGAGGGPVDASQSNTNLQPTLMPYGLNGLPVVDFGSYLYGSGAQTNRQWLGFDAQMTDVRSVFWVGHGQNFILGDDNTYHFHRGGEDTTSALWHTTYTASAVKDGQTRLNGTNVNGTVTGLPDAFSIVSVIATNTIASVRSAITDLGQRYAAAYGALAAGYLARLADIEDAYLAAQQSGDSAGVQLADAAFQRLKREALVLDNPALAFNRLLFVRRATGLGLPQNWQSLSSIGETSCDDRIGLLDLTNNVVSDFHVPASAAFVGYPKPHWNGDRLLFTSVFVTNSARSYGVFEMNVDGTGLRRVSPYPGSDVDWYDACYLPCGELLMCGTATFAGVPCVTGSDHVANLYRVNPTNGVVRQLTFDQDQNWGPTILADGRVMFTRWEYSDTPHYFSRILFTMMPDGLEQFARYGSASHWPNTLFDVQPVPGRPSQFVAIISGHHGVAREGEMILFDENQGTQEAEGVVHRFCGPNPVLPEVRDQYINERDPWPRARDRSRSRRGTGRNADSAFCARCSRCWTGTAPVVMEGRAGRPTPRRIWCPPTASRPAAWGSRPATPSRSRM